MCSLTYHYQLANSFVNTFTPCIIHALFHSQLKTRPFLQCHGGLVGYVSKPQYVLCITYIFFYSFLFHILTSCNFPTWCFAIFVVVSLIRAPVWVPGVRRDSLHFLAGCRKRRLNNSSQLIGPADWVFVTLGPLRCAQPR